MQALSQSKHQALNQLGPAYVSTTGGQHESMQQRQRQRVMSFSEASDTDSNLSQLEYAKEQGITSLKLANLSFPRSNGSTNSGSDVDGMLLRRRHRQQSHASQHPQRRRAQQEDSEDNEQRGKIRFSTPKKKSSAKPSAVDAQRRDFVHPYAHQPTPYEKLQEICTNFGETSMFISYEVLVWLLDKIWGLLINLLLLPIAILGLALDYLRHWARRVSGISFSN